MPLSAPRRCGSFVAEAATIGDTPARPHRSLIAACACCGAGLFGDAPRDSFAITPNAALPVLSGPASSSPAPGVLRLDPAGFLAMAMASTKTRPLHAGLDAAALAVEQKMIGWRRDFHKNPELGNQEVR